MTFAILSPLHDVTIHVQFRQREQAIERKKLFDVNQLALKQSKHKQSNKQASKK